MKNTEERIFLILLFMVLAFRCYSNDPCGDWGQLPGSDCCSRDLISTVTLFDQKCEVLDYEEEEASDCGTNDCEIWERYKMWLEKEYEATFDVEINTYEYNLDPGQTGTCPGDVTVYENGTNLRLELIGFKIIHFACIACEWDSGPI